MADFQKRTAVRNWIRSNQRSGNWSLISWHTCMSNIQSRCQRWKPLLDLRECRPIRNWDFEKPGGKGRNEERCGMTNWMPRGQRNFECSPQGHTATTWSSFMPTTNTSRSASSSSLKLFVLCLACYFWHSYVIARHETLRKKFKLFWAVGFARARARALRGSKKDALGRARARARANPSQKKFQV